MPFPTSGFQPISLCRPLFRQRHLEYPDVNQVNRKDRQTRGRR